MTVHLQLQEGPSGPSAEGATEKALPRRADVERVRFHDPSRSIDDPSTVKAMKTSIALGSRFLSSTICTIFFQRQGISSQTMSIQHSLDMLGHAWANGMSSDFEIR